MFMNMQKKECQTNFWKENIVCSKLLPVEKKLYFGLHMSYDRNLPHGWLSSCLCYYFTMFRLA